MIIATLAYLWLLPDEEKWAHAYGIFMLALSVSILSIMVKRLHDLDMSGWWVLLGVVVFGSTNVFRNEVIRIISDVVLLVVTAWLGAAKGTETKTGEKKSNWYYAKGQETVGPISQDKLVALLRSVSRLNDVFVWRTGFQDWMKVGDLPQLLRAIDRPPPLPETGVARADATSELKAAAPATIDVGPASEKTSRSSILEKTKALGGALLGLAIFLAITALPILFLFGATWVAEHIIEYVAKAAGVILLVCIFIFLPLALFRATRVVSVYGLLCSSYVFGLGV
jgi:hypothetical protein